MFNPVPAWWHVLWLTDNYRKSHLQREHCRNVLANATIIRDSCLWLCLFIASGRWSWAVCDDAGCYTVDVAKAVREDTLVLVKRIGLELSRVMQQLLASGSPRWEIYFIGPDVDWWKYRTAGMWHTCYWLGAIHQIASGIAAESLPRTGSVRSVEDGPLTWKKFSGMPHHSP